MGDRRQDLVIDRDQLGGVLRGGRGRRDDCGDDLADMADLGADDGGLLRAHDRRAVKVLDADVGRVGVGDVGQRVEPVGDDVGMGQHREDSGQGAGGGGVDRADQRVRVRRAHHHGTGLARQVDVVAVAAVAGQQAQILPPPYRPPDPCARSRRSVHRASQ
jgi:hypothetical protein